jgi:hypothetical protein
VSYPKHELVSQAAVQADVGRIAKRTFSWQFMHSDSICSTTCGSSPSSVLLTFSALRPIGSNVSVAMSAVCFAPCCL